MHRGHQMLKAWAGDERESMQHAVENGCLPQKVSGGRGWVSSFFLYLQLDGSPLYSSYNQNQTGLFSDPPNGSCLVCSLQMGACLKIK